MKEFKSKPLIGLNDLSDDKFTLQRLSQVEVGRVTGKILGKKNAESGHMKNIQKIGCSIGGTISGNNKTKEQLKEISKLGNEANQQLHGKRIIGTNVITGESWEYISNHEASRDTDVPTCTIRKILRGQQPKTKTGWTFSEK